MQEAMLSSWARAASEPGEISYEAAAEWLVNRRSALAAKRSRIGSVIGCFCQAARHALSRQVAVKQHLIAHQVGVDWHAQGVCHASHRRQCEAGKSGAEDQRRDHDMEPIKTACRQKMRNRPGASLDQSGASPDWTRHPGLRPGREEFRFGAELSFRRLSGLTVVPVHR